MKIYLAGSCGSERRTHMVALGTALREAGYSVYCPFELKIENAWDMSQEKWAQKVFDNDILAINNSDIVVMISPGRQSTAGTNWEQGYAYALGKPVYVFQYTEEPTSLMTYCAATNFFTMDDITALSPEMFAKFVVTRIKYKDKVNKNTCTTILT